MAALQNAAAGLEECENDDCTGCAYCDAMGYTRQKPESLPPPGWQDAFDTWMRHWRRAYAELVRNPDSCRAMAVERTSYRRLAELAAQRYHP